MIQITKENFWQTCAATPLMYSSEGWQMGRWAGWQILCDADWTFLSHVAVVEVKKLQQSKFSIFRHQSKYLLCRIQKLNKWQTTGRILAKIFFEE